MKVFEKTTIVGFSNSQTKKNTGTATDRCSREQSFDKKSTDVFNCFSIDVEHIFFQHFPVADSAIAVLSKRHNSYY